MYIIKKMLAVLVSIRTAIWLLLALVLILLYGSIVMPLHEEFLALHSVPLFPWLMETRINITWWLWAAIAVLSLLTANTVVCSIESVIKKRESRKWLLILAPQIMHIGFLFILLAHLLSSTGGFRGTAYAYKDSVFQLPNGLEIKFNEVNAGIDASGYVRDWSADITYFRDGRLLANDRILPNSPSLREGLGIYIKTVKVAPFPVALIEVSREPGAFWALVGGALFMAGMIILLLLQIRKEDASERILPSLTKNQRSPYNQ